MPTKPCPYCEPDDKSCLGYGLCHCGCGKATKISDIIHKTKGKMYPAGSPFKFIQHHHARTDSARKKFGGVVGSW